MPVLTCPFQKINQTQILAQEIQFPKKTILRTELTIKPVASETWHVEGLTFQFTTEYTAAYFVRVKKEEEVLVKSREILKGSLVNLKAAEKAAFEASEFAKQLWVNAGSKVPSEELVNWKNAETSYFAALQAVQGTENEIEQIEGSIKNLGKTTALEGVRSPPLIVVARVYARGNELVWEDQPTPLRFSSGVLSPSPAGGTREAVNNWNETFNSHVQFDDPIDFTERENLTFTLEFTSPRAFIESEEGLEVIGPFLNVSEVQAVVNYSSSMAGEQ